MTLSLLTGWTKATWRHERTGKEKRGEWYYNWPKNRFSVRIGNGEPFAVYADSPEWGYWKLVRDGRQG